MRHREGSARRRRSDLARRRHVVPGRVLEPPDPPQRRSDRRGRDVPRHHRAAAGRAGDPGGRAAARAVPGDAVARAAQSAGRDPERDARARQCERGPTTRATRPARSSTRQANHMARLLDDLLDVARITRGRIMLRNEVVDLRDTARSAIEALGPFMAERETRARRSTSPTSRCPSSAIRRGCSRSRRTCSATRRSTRRAAAHVRFELRARGRPGA